MTAIIVVLVIFAIIEVLYLGVLMADGFDNPHHWFWPVAAIRQIKEVHDEFIEDQESRKRNGTIRICQKGDKYYAEKYIYSYGSGDWNQLREIGDMHFWSTGNGFSMVVYSSSMEQLQELVMRVEQEKRDEGPHVVGEFRV